jgi:hypothetical protein
MLDQIFRECNKKKVSLKKKFFSRPTKAILRDVLLLIIATLAPPWSSRDSNAQIKNPSPSEELTRGKGVSVLSVMHKAIIPNFYNTTPMKKQAPKIIFRSYLNFWSIGHAFRVMLFGPRFSHTSGPLGAPLVVPLANSSQSPGFRQAFSGTSREKK